MERLNADAPPWQDPERLLRPSRANTRVILEEWRRFGVPAWTKEFESAGLDVCHVVHSLYSGYGSFQRLREAANDWDCRRTMRSSLRIGVDTSCPSMVRRSSSDFTSLTPSREPFAPRQERREIS